MKTTTYDGSGAKCPSADRIILIWLDDPPGPILSFEGAIGILGGRFEHFIVTTLALKARIERRNKRGLI
jgi:hypothetical protein